MTGTDEERGILLWREIPGSSDDDINNPDSNSLNLSMKTYDIPFVTKYLRRWKYSKYVPFLPTFDGFNDLKSCCKGSSMDLAETEVVFSARDNETTDVYLEKMDRNKYSEQFAS